MSKRILIGITGGIASGKSTVCRLFGKRGFLVIDADDINSRILDRAGIRDKLVNEFGKGIAGENGRINRKKLALFIKSSESINNPSKQFLLRNHLFLFHVF